MTSKTQIFNNALAALGEPSVVGPDDAGTVPKRLRTLYDSAVRWVFEQHPWNFCQTVQALSVNVPNNPDPDNTDRPIGWQYACNKPAGCWRILGINRSGRLEDPNISYDDAGGQILCDADDAYIIFIDAKWLTLEGSWPEVVAHAVEMTLAARATPPTTNNRGKKADTETLATRAMRIAKVWDSQQKPQRQAPEGRYVSARRAWPSLGNKGENG